MNRDVNRNVNRDVNRDVNRNVYLDHAATTPVHPEAVDAMLPWLRDNFGNPSGVHRHAQEARQAIEESRDKLSAVLGCAARELVFTGSGTEALNHALAAAAPDGRQSGVGGDAVAVRAHARRSLLVVSAVEHDAVRNTVAALAQHGRGLVVELAVEETGVLDLALAGELFGSVDPVAAVAVMAVNNEVGTIQPLAELASLVRTHSPQALFIVDAVQALAWIDVRPITALSDLLAISAHKFGGPKGVGALMIREGLSPEPLLHGGGQERDRRSGTQNVAGIVGMAEAAVLTDARRSDVVARVAALRDRLVDGLLAAVDGATETSPRATKIAGNAHLCIEGVESEALLILLDAAGLSASAGSACASGAIHASPVLLAMNVSEARALGSLRLSLGAATTAADVDHALAVIPPAVAQLRASV